METILYTGRYLPTSKAIFLTESKNLTKMTTQYLNDYVDTTWNVFSPLQSKRFIQHDNTRRSLYGRYLLFTSDTRGDRAIMVTERYSLADNGGKICFSFAAFKSNSHSILEIYQGESYSDSMATKLWDYQGFDKDWQTFEILAMPQKNTSLDIFFYIVSKV